MSAELLLTKTTADYPEAEDYAFYLDFEDQPIGKQTLQDLSPNRIVVPRLGTPSANFGVMDHPTIGKCFRFDASAYFYGDPGVLRGFSVGNYDLDVGILKPNTVAQTIFGTGNYGAAGNIVSGITISMDQYPATSFQNFVFNVVGSQFRRHFAPGTNPQTFMEYQIRKRSTGTNMINKTAGTNSTYPVFNNPTDTYLAIGATRGGANALNGYLKYLKIKRLP